MLKNKTALVTGGASGIGRATALILAREGAKILVADRNTDEAQITARMIIDAGGEAIATTTDVTDANDVKLMIKTAIDAWGRLDCAFNNAGIGTAATNAGGIRTGDLSDDAWNTMIAVNLTSVWTCMKHELIQMEQQGSGAIVNTASIAGLIGLPRAGAYVAAKHGVIGLTKAAAIDHPAIRINAVCPGYIETAMTTETIARRGDQITATTILKRFGAPNEIAEAVAWLCSDRASYMTGTAMTVDGGYTTV